jgi:hypothetical protein
VFWQRRFLIFTSFRPGYLCSTAASRALADHGINRQGGLNAPNERSSAEKKPLQGE